MFDVKVCCYCAQKLTEDDIKATELYTQTSLSNSQHQYYK